MLSPYFTPIEELTGSNNSLLYRIYKLGYLYNALMLYNNLLGIFNS